MSFIEIDTLRTRFASSEWPTFDSVVKDECENDRTVIIDITIDKGVRWFEGHFPEQPVLAGVVQTHWAGELSKFVFDIEDDFIRIDNLKFQAVVLPGLSMSLSLVRNEEKNSVKFSFSKGDTMYSEGRLVFAKG